MTDKSPQNTDKERPETLADRIGKKADRKLKARQRGSASVWFGLGMMGLVGWSIAVPTLLGAALGIWLDKNDPSGRSWTLALLTMGLVIGCLNAWHWLSKESKAINEDDINEKHDE